MKPWAFVVDFDGTITVGDTADAILVKFAVEPGAAFERSHRTQVVTEAWVYEKYKRVRTPVEVIRRFALQTAAMRDGFDRLAKRCRAARLPVEIVSGGLDLYLDALLERWELDWIPRYRGTSRETLASGLSVRYRFLKGGKMTLDDFKATRVQRQLDRGRRVLFAGDGPSDLKAAKLADVRFARGWLASALRRERVPFRRFTTFDPIERMLLGDMG